MKPIISSALALILFCVNTFGATWGNGGTSKSLNNPKFGTHDWIAYEGLLLAQKDKDLDWIAKNLNAFFIGTEAPDLGVRGMIPNAGSGYKDTGKCHCILFDANTEVTNNRLIIRVQEEFDKAKNVLNKAHPTKADYQRAAFYLGAMAHYLGDLSQFMHLMGKQSHWGSEDQKIHHAYEAVIDKSVKFQTRTSAILESYIKKKSVAGTKAGDVALMVATFTETGGNSEATPGWMYKRFKKYIADGTSTDSTEWDSEFLDQTGNNVNTSVNAVAKLLKEFAQN